MNTPTDSPSWRIIETLREHIGTQYVTASNNDIARALGITRAAVSDYKKGRSRMSAATVSRVLDVLGDDGWKIAEYTSELMEQQATSEVDRSMWRLIRRAAEAAKKMTPAFIASIAVILAAGIFLASPENLAYFAFLGVPELYIMRSN